MECLSLWNDRRERTREMKGAYVPITPLNEKPVEKHTKEFKDHTEWWTVKKWAWTQHKESVT